MSIRCLQHDAIGALQVARADFPVQPFITLTELITFGLWGAPLTPGDRGTLRNAINQELATERARARNPQSVVAAGNQIIEKINRRIALASDEIYQHLSAAIANKRLVLWGRRQVGPGKPTGEHEAIDPTYLLVARHHDLLDNELHEEIQHGDELQATTLLGHRQIEREVRFIDVRVSGADAKRFMSEHFGDSSMRPDSAPRYPATADGSPRRWRRLPEAIAWVVTRDDAFCAAVGSERSTNLSLQCVLMLEHAMTEEGCFDTFTVPVTLHPGSDALMIQRHSLRVEYRGRFLALAERYGDGGNSEFTKKLSSLPHSVESEAGWVSVSDFLLGQWHEAFDRIAAKIADGEIQARGVAQDTDRRTPNGEMPPSSIGPRTAMDLEGSVWEAPFIFGEEPPRHWVDVQINWENLRSCFPEVQVCRDTITVGAETACRRWLVSQMRASPDRRPKAKMNYFLDAKMKFPGIGWAEKGVSRSFDRAWLAAAKETGVEAVWGRAGRTRKSPR